MESIRDASSWVGRNATSMDGQDLGQIKQVVIDATTGDRTWGLVEVGQRGDVIVPLDAAAQQGNDVVLPYHARAVAEFPHVEEGQGLTDAVLRAAVEHFGPPVALVGTVVGAIATGGDVSGDPEIDYAQADGRLAFADELSGDPEIDY